jgi:hypothetical protein
MFGKLVGKILTIDQETQFSSQVDEVLRVCHSDGLVLEDHKMFSFENALQLT